MTAPEKPWTPEYKLRADATSEQIMSRHLALECEIGGLNAIEQVARELAAARVTQAHDFCNAELAVWERRYETMLAEKDAEIARLRLDAELLDWLDAQVMHPRVVYLQLDPPQGLRDTFTAHMHLNGEKPGPWVQQATPRGLARKAIEAAIDAAKETK